MACLYKRDGIYWVRFTSHGNEIRRSAKTKSRQAAQRFLDRQIADYEAIGRNGEPRRKYDAAVERFVQDHLATLKISTQARYRTSLRQMTCFTDV